MVSIPCAFSQQESSVYKNTYYPFNGAWLPDTKSELIGANNYKTLINLRPIEEGIEGVNGYTYINTSVGSPSYLLPRAGFHFNKDYPLESHVLVQFYNYNGTQSQIFDNQTTIPNQGDFDTTPLHIDASSGIFTGEYSHNLKFASISTATHKTKFANISTPTHNTKFEDISATGLNSYETPQARFSKAPMGHMIYSNGVETQIWGGNETRVGAFLLSSSNVTEYITNPRDYTDQINNEYDTSLERVTIDASATTAYFVVGSTRPISGVSFYVRTTNGTAASIHLSEWTGAAWRDLTETDGTNGLANNGQVSFTSTVDTSKPKYLAGQVLYWYVGQLSAGSAVIYNVKLSTPWQNLVDLWDQVYRTPISFQVNRSQNYKDYTLEVNEGSSDLFPIGAEVGGLKATDEIIMMFEDRLQGIYFELLSGNTNAFSGTSIYYWNGTEYAESGVTYDHTGSITGVTPLGQSGALTWHPPAHSSEFKQYLFGQYGYVYKVKYGGTLGWTGAPESAVIIDRVYGITAPYKLHNFSFPAFHLNRVFLFGYLKGNMANRVDFSSVNAPEVWNGRDSSDDMRQSLFIGGEEKITAAQSVFNRFGSQIYSQLVVFKQSELYTILGTSPDPETPNMFAVHKISGDLGCPAPLTLTSMEIGFLMSQNQPERNILVWLSASGPYIFDGSFPKPLGGINSYFDPKDDNYVGVDNIENAFAWYDSIFTEWNLRVGDYWFVYNFTLAKWFRKDTGAAYAIQMAIPVIDAKGNKYTYGGIDTGYLMRLEDGTSWDGTAITQTVETGDFYLDNNAWNETVMRRVRLANRVISEDATLQVTHYKDTSTSGTSIMSVNLSDGDLVSRRQTEPLNNRAYWHRLRFEVATSNTNKGFQPLGWGFQENTGLMREDRK